VEVGEKERERLHAGWRERSQNKGKEREKKTRRKERKTKARSEEGVDEEARVQVRDMEGEQLRGSSV
jgi:hypothetical protein